MKTDSKICLFRNTHVQRFKKKYGTMKYYKLDIGGEKLLNLKLVLEDKGNVNP